MKCDLNLFGRIGLGEISGLDIFSFQKWSLSAYTKTTAPIG